MLVKDIRNLRHLLPYDMGKEVVAFSTRRHGLGVSTGNYSSLNINPFCGDNIENVERNRALLAASLGVGENSLVLPHQVHDNRVEILHSDFLSLNKAERATRLDGIDALLTDVRGLCIGVSTADCVPVLLYDHKNKAVGAVHAGWRGTVKRIAQTAVEKMVAEYGSSPADLVAVIGPSISREAFEVGDEVYDAFDAEGFPMPQIACRINNRWHIDLWQCNRLQLLSAGLLASNITVSGICTYFHSNDFFSARRFGINSGRIYSGIILI